MVARLGEAESTPREDSTAPPTVFARRVTLTLARGLQTTTRLTRSWDERALDQPGRLGLSAGLVESIEEIVRPDLRILDLSF